MTHNEWLINSYYRLESAIAPPARAYTCVFGTNVTINPNSQTCKLNLSSVSSCCLVSPTQVLCFSTPRINRPGYLRHKTATVVHLTLLSNSMDSDTEPQPFVECMQRAGVRSHFISHRYCPCQRALNLQIALKPA